MGLLVSAKPSEAAQKFLLQQVGKQVFYAGGFHSGEELMKLLQLAHNIQSLPAPSGVVVGSAANEKDYKELSADEAEQLRRKDAESVQGLLRGEAIRIQLGLSGGEEVAGGPVVEASKRIEPPPAPPKAAAGE